MLAHPSGSASPNLPSASLRRISRHFPQIRKHPRRHCGAGEEVKYIVPKRYFDSLVLQDDYRKLPKEEQKILIEMVREGLGRYPKWYREDSVEKK